MDPFPPTPHDIALSIILYVLCCLTYHTIFIIYEWLFLCNSSQVFFIPPCCWSFQVDSWTLLEQFSFLDSCLVVDLCQGMEVGVPSVQSLSRVWLCNPMNCSSPGSSVHGIFQARTLEWIAMSLVRGSYRPRDWAWVSCIAGRVFIVWATREALIILKNRSNYWFFSLNKLQKQGFNLIKMFIWHILTYLLYIITDK